MQRNQRTQKVQKVPKRININIGVILFIIILIYTIVNVYLYIVKPKISIYEVVEQGLAQDNIVTGIITREEVDVISNTSGYVNYYHRDGAKIAKNATIYSIDESRRIYEKLADYSQEVTMSKEDTNSVKKKIVSYKKKLEDGNYSMIYAFKDDLSSSIQSVIDENLLTNMQTITNETGIESTFQVVKTNQTGIISYYTDNYTGLKASGITSSIFDQANYVRKNLRSNEITEAGQPVYRLITDQNWTITALIDESLANQLQGKKSLSITFLLDGVTTSAPISIYQSQNDWYLEISLDKYVVNYSRERFLDIELNLAKETGLKIPKSAICIKEFYMIPNSYLTNGGNSDQQGVMLEVYDEKRSEIVPTFIACEVYYQDEEYSYVDKETFEFNQYIQNIVTGDRFPISMVGKLEGVYNVNKGYAVFRRIEKLAEGEEYVIIKKGSEKGVSIYDHLALNAELVTESSVIY